MANRSELLGQRWWKSAAIFDGELAVLFEIVGTVALFRIIKDLRVKKQGRVPHSWYQRIGSNLRR